MGRKTLCSVKTLCPTLRGKLTLHMTRRQRQGFPLLWQRNLAFFSARCKTRKLKGPIPKHPSDIFNKDSGGIVSNCSTETISNITQVFCIRRAIFPAIPRASTTSLHLPASTSFRACWRALYMALCLRRNSSNHASSRISFSETARLHTELPPI
jgi:hypothetical protein